MKSLRSILAVLCAGLFCLTASSCWFWGGYNGVMYKFFLDKENYEKITVTLSDFVWVDYSAERVAYSFYENSDSYREYANNEEDCSFYMHLSYIEGVSEGWIWCDGECRDISFSLCPKNAMELIENGLLENVALGDEITIYTTMWTYSDTNFFKITAVESGGKTYLDFDTGLENFKTYMNENRSLL